MSVPVLWKKFREHDGATVYRCIHRSGWCNCNDEDDYTQRRQFRWQDDHRHLRRYTAVAKGLSWSIKGTITRHLLSYRWLGDGIYSLLASGCKRARRRYVVFGLDGTWVSPSKTPCHKAEVTPSLQATNDKLQYVTRSSTRSSAIADDCRSSNHNHIITAQGSL